MGGRGGSSSTVEGSRSRRGRTPKVGPVTPAQLILAPERVTSWNYLLGGIKTNSFTTTPTPHTLLLRSACTERAINHLAARRLLTTAVAILNTSTSISYKAFAGIFLPPTRTTTRRKTCVYRRSCAGVGAQCSAHEEIMPQKDCPGFLMFCTMSLCSSSISPQFRGHPFFHFIFASRFCPSSV